MEVVFTKTHPCPKCDTREAEYMEKLPELRSKFPNIKFSEGENSITSKVTPKISPGIFMTRGEEILGCYLPLNPEGFACDIELWIYSFMGIPKHLLKDYDKLVIIMGNHNSIPCASLPKFSKYKYLVNLRDGDPHATLIELINHNDKLPPLDMIEFKKVETLDDIRDFLPSRIKPDLSKRYLILTNNMEGIGSFPEIQFEKVSIGISLIKYVVDIDIPGNTNADFTIIDLSDNSIISSNYSLKSGVYFAKGTLLEKLEEYKSTGTFDNQFTIMNDLGIPTILLFVKLGEPSNIKRFSERLKHELDNRCIVKVLEYDENIDIFSFIKELALVNVFTASGMTKNIFICYPEQWNGFTLSQGDSLVYKDIHQEDIFTIIKAKLNIWTRDKMQKLE